MYPMILCCGRLSPSTEVLSGPTMATGPPPSVYGTEEGVMVTTGGSSFTAVMYKEVFTGAEFAMVTYMWIMIHWYKV